MNTLRNERGMIVNWLLKVVLALMLSGIVLYDAGAVIVNYVTLDSSAEDIARELATDMTATASVPVATTVADEARLLAREAGARLVGSRVDPDGMVHVKVRRTARTLLVRRIDAVRRWGRAVATGRARTS
jgi:hypothetical protein